MPFTKCCTVYVSEILQNFSSHISWLTSLIFPESQVITNDCKVYAPQGLIQSLLRKYKHINKSKDHAIISNLYSERQIFFFQYSNNCKKIYIQQKKPIMAILILRFFRRPSRVDNLMALVNSTMFINTYLYSLHFTSVPLSQKRCQLAKCFYF